MSARATSPQTLPGLGTVLQGKYRLDAVLGEGGMGVVFAALHLHLQERVAVKVLKPERANTRKLAERLVREARAAVRLKNEHVVRILDAGTLEDEQPFIVMEYLHGEDLSKVLARRGPLPVREAVDYLLQACEAIAEAHSSGIVHRDLKPANVFLERAAGGARIKVLDFGISRALDASAEGAAGVTSTHSLVGSPAYASPEQLTSPELVDERTDIWALGVLAYELLTGSSPFAATSLALVCTRVLNEQPPSLRSKRPDVPAALERSVEKAIKKRPEQRQQTVLELARSLAELATPGAAASVAWIETLKLQPSGPSSGDVSDASEAGSITSTSASLRKVLPAAPRTRLVVGVTSAVVLAAVGYVALRGRSDARPALSSASATAPAHATSAAAPPRPSTALVAPGLGDASTAPSSSPSRANVAPRRPAAPSASAPHLVPRASPAAVSPAASAARDSDDIYIHRK